MGSEPLTVLLTGSGAPGTSGTVYCLRAPQVSRKITILGSDIRSHTVGRYFVDRFFTLPAPEEAGYLERLVDIITSERVKVIVPQTTREIEVLSRDRDRLLTLGTGVVVSGPKAVDTANCKYNILKACEKAGVPTPRYRLCRGVVELDAALNWLGYPEVDAVVKPRRGSGMRGLRVLSEKPISAASFLQDKPRGERMRREDFLTVFSDEFFEDMLVTEYLPGDEYTVDAFRNQQGCLAIPRLRRSIRSGISFESRVEMRADLIGHSRALAELIDLQYCFGFQFKCDAAGTPRMLEANPRVQGTMVTACFAGFNMIHAAVMEAVGEPVSLEGVDIKDGTEFLRYWGGLGVYGGNVLDRI